MAAAEWLPQNLSKSLFSTRKPYHLELKIGDLIQATENFGSNSMKEKQIKSGTIMEVLNVDTDGDIIVSSENWEKGEWILKRNFMKLEKITHQDIKMQGHRIYFDSNHQKTKLKPQAKDVVKTEMFRTFSALSLDPERPEDSLLSLLPNELRETALDDSQNMCGLHEIILDYGQRPYAIFCSNRKPKYRRFIHLNPLFLVSKEMINDIIKNLSIGDDNRAGIDGMLHRISVMKNRKGEIYGLTLRVGRTFENNACMIEDILLHEDFAKKSILVMGNPGSGKTSVIRSLAKSLSDNEKNVVIVDTSNEIGGDGDRVHKSLGLCRRLMVPKVSAQSDVMIEGLQNHTPDVMVIDEISRKAEAQAAKTIKFRGVRLIASAHGSFKELLKNSELNSLVGGFRSVILSAKEVSEQRRDKKTKTERVGALVFDVIIELSPNDFNQWKIITNVTATVDAILENRPYTILKRSRNQDKYNPKIYEEEEIIPRN